MNIHNCLQPQYSNFLLYNQWNLLRIRKYLLKAYQMEIFLKSCLFKVLYNYMSKNSSVYKQCTVSLYRYFAVYLSCLTVLRIFNYYTANFILRIFCYIPRFCNIDIFLIHCSIISYVFYNLNIEISITIYQKKNVILVKISTIS